MAKEVPGKAERQNEAELEPDAWERFEKAIDRVVKTPAKAPANEEKPRPD